LKELGFIRDFKGQSYPSQFLSAKRERKQKHPMNNLQSYYKPLDNQFWKLQLSSYDEPKISSSNGGVSSSLLAGASNAGSIWGVFDSFGYNHTSYPTTKGTMKNFSDFTGRKMSSQALKYAGRSKLVSRVGNWGTGVMIFQSAYNYYNGDRSVVNYIDGGVGLMGLGNTASIFLTGAGCAAIGPLVALYGALRLMMDASDGERMQIRDNIMNNIDPLYNVYNPSLGF